jgi:flagellar hook-basal body complex protein FliE
MSSITELLASEAIQTVTDVVTKSTTTSEEEDSSSFEVVLKSLLDPDEENQINEEELFAALIEERVGDLKGEDVADVYHSALETQKESHTRADGYCWLESAANAALNDLVEGEYLTEDEADDIQSQAFQAAQLDSDETQLFDSRGSGSDPSIALMEMESALVQAKAKMEELAEEDSDSTDDDSTDSESSTVELIEPSGTSVDGTGEGFLYKPESDSGNLVILLPNEYHSQVESVILKDSSGSTIEEGYSSGYANADSTGEREHFRFSHPGEDYPDDLVVEVTLDDGSVIQYSIPDSSERYD